MKGARVNNLKNISVDIPRGELVAVAGVSGSGKSSLAFDTLYAEGQRRYVESLSSYARQFLGRMKKPECDYIKGLPPAIAIEQKVVARNPRSTVGTSTEIYDYLRLLFARVGRTVSPVSGAEVSKHTAEDVVSCVAGYSKGTRFMVLAPLRVPPGRTVSEQLRAAALQGYARLWVGGEAVGIDDFAADVAMVEATPPEDIYILVDRLVADDTKDAVSRLVDSSETAMYEGDGACRLVFLPSGIQHDFSNRFEADGIVFSEPTDQMFSFNSPAGACPVCEGFGNTVGIDEKLVVPDTSESLHGGCVKCWHGPSMAKWKERFELLAAKDGFPIHKAYSQLTAEQRGWLWHGLPQESSLPARERTCIDSFFAMVAENAHKVQYRVLLSRYRGRTLCPECRGTRLRKEAGWVKIAGRSIADLVQMPVSGLKEWFDGIVLGERDAAIAKRLLTEINSRLQFLIDVGLPYLILNRRSNTLSGGESQRINLTTSLGSSLVGSLYILDEPSIGLHSRDTDRLIGVLRKLQEVGNTVVVVEHDEEIMRAADHIIDIGPEAGTGGGRVVFQGDAADITPEAAELYPESYSVKYLTGKETIDVPVTRRSWNMSLLLKGAMTNNLRNVDARFPLNAMTVVTGVSGSGKSSLVKGTLYPALCRLLDKPAEEQGTYASLEGDTAYVRDVEFVDQNPIGASSRSNPVTYVKAYDTIRSLYADQPLAKQLRLTAGHFSFNTEGGRCEECKGAGVVTVEMQFMADLTLECEECHGKRFNKDVLSVEFHGKNINDILELTIDEAMAFFGGHGQKSIVKRLKPLADVGLGYVKMGQASSTLSGGENQRVKLAYFIGDERKEHTLFIFDEPTTGLHFHDIRKLLGAFGALISKGHTVVVIEHNLDVVKCADYVIDIGPEGGAAGGAVVVQGTPEEVAACKESITGRYLKGKLA